MSNCTLSPEIVNLSAWLHRIVHTGMIPSYLVVGLSANIILLLSFYKHASTDQPYNYQVLLTVSKTLEVVVFGSFEVGLNYLSGAAGSGVAWFRRQYVLMVMVMRAGQVAHLHCILSSLLFAVAMSADRVFALAFPFQYKSINHVRHQIVAACVCFVLPSVVSISYTWFFDVVPEDDHYSGVINTVYAQSTFMKVNSCVFVAMRLVAIAVLIMLNIWMILAFRIRTSNVAKMTNRRGEIPQAKKEVNKALMILNLWQSILMCVNQFPHVLLHALITISPDSIQCLLLPVLAPMADAFIYVTDSIDLIIILAINKKMRNMVREAVCCCAKDHVTSVNRVTPHA